MTPYAYPRTGLAKLHIPRLRLRDFRVASDVPAVHFASIGSLAHMLSHLQWQIDQHSADSRSNSQRFQSLLRFQTPESPRLSLRLLLRELRFNGFLVNRQPLPSRSFCGQLIPFP